MDTLYNEFNKTNDRIDALEIEMNRRFDSIDEELSLIRDENKEKSKEVNEIKVDLGYIKRDLRKETLKDLRTIFKLAIFFLILLGIIAIIVILAIQDETAIN